MEVIGGPWENGVGPCDLCLALFSRFPTPISSSTSGSIRSEAVALRSFRLAKLSLVLLLVCVTLYVCIFDTCHEAYTGAPSRLAA